MSPLPVRDITLGARRSDVCRSYAVGLFSVDLSARPAINTLRFELSGSIAAQKVQLNGCQRVITGFCNRVTPKENEDPKKIQEHCIDSTRTYAVWVSFAKGGGFRQYSSNQHLVINWYQNGKELKVYNANLYGSVSRNVRSESHYFRPGITWSYLPLKRGSFRILPGGSIFSVGGPALFSNQESLLTILSVLNSDAFFALMRFFMPRGTGISQATLKFEVGYVQKVPFPNLSKNQIVMLSDLSIRIHDASRALDIYDELSPQFTIPLIIVDNHNIGLRESSFKSNQMVKLLNDRKLSLQEQIDRVVFEAYGLSTSLWCKTLYNQVKPT